MIKNQFNADFATSTAHPVFHYRPVTGIDTLVVAIDGMWVGRTDGEVCFALRDDPPFGGGLDDARPAQGWREL